MRGLLIFAIACSLQAQVTLTKANGSVSSYAGSALQQAYTDADCGSIIEIDTAATSNGITIPAKGCTAWPGIITRSARHYALDLFSRVQPSEYGNMGAISAAAANTSPVIQFAPGAAYYRFVGIKVVSRNNLVYDLVMLAQNMGGTIADSTVDREVHHIAFDHCSIQGVDGYPVRNGLTANGAMIEFNNSEIINIRTGDGSGAAVATSDESHGFVASGGRGPWFLKNNKIAGGAIGVIWGGSTHPLAGQIGMWAVARANYFYRPFKWLMTSGTVDPSGTCPYDPEDGYGNLFTNTTTPSYWRCHNGAWETVASLAAFNALRDQYLPTKNKNIFEFKGMVHGVVEANILNGAYGWNALNQTGACFLFNISDYVGANDTQTAWTQVRDIDVVNNHCRNTPVGMVLGKLNLAALGGYTAGNPTLIKVANARLLTSGKTYLVGINGGCMSFAERVVTVVDETTISVPAASTAGCGLTPTVIRGQTWQPSPHWAIRVENNQFLYGNDEYTFPSYWSASNIADVSRGLQFGGSYIRDFTYRHNTVWSGTTKTAVRYNAVEMALSNTDGVSFPNTIPYPRGVVVSDNVFNYANGWLESDAGGSTSWNALNNGLGKNATLGRNIHADVLSKGATAFRQNIVDHCSFGQLDCPYTNATTSYPATCAGCDLIANTNIAASFVDSANKNFRLTSTNPGYRKATDGLDTGADIDQIDCATATAYTGGSNPCLGFRLQGATPAATSLTVRYTAVSSSACTVTAMQWGDPFGTPVASTTDSGGAIDRSVVLTGLASGRDYALKVTCGSNSVRGRARTL